MHFPRPVTNLGFQQLRLGKQSEDCQMPLWFPGIHHQTVFPSSHTPNQFVLDLSGAETLTQTNYFQNGEECMKISHESQIAPPQVDYLSATFEKINVKGFMESHVSMEGPPPSIPLRFGAAPYGSGVLSNSLDSIESNNKARLRYAEESAYTISEIKERFPSSSKRRRINMEEEEKPLKRTRSESGVLTASSTFRENHIISERQRRSEMNHLFAQMHSLLPNPTAQRDKASVVTEIINYIRSLQRQLAILPKKHEATILQNKTVGGTIPVKSEPISSVVETRQTGSSGCDRSDAGLSLCSKSCEQNLTLNYTGKDIFITMSSVAKSNLLPSIILVMESHNIEVMDAFVSTTDTVAFHCLRGQVGEVLNKETRGDLHSTLKKLMKSEVEISFVPKVLDSKQWTPLNGH